MHSTAEFLWRLNRNYVNRLLRARNTLGLLEHVLRTRANADVQETLLPTVQDARNALSRLSEAHRDWCYTYFYESAETKRMVQTAQGVRRALAHFEAMRRAYGDLFAALDARLSTLPPPPADLTTLPHGDLWDMAQYSLHALANLPPLPEA